jgi:putative flavoprotein involved in K+ transport
MNPPIYDAIVIGAGQAGLSISYQLMKYNLNHVVFEQGKIGESWRSQRWESFRLNTANKLNILPGQENIFPDPEGFSSAPEFVSFLEGYSKTFKLPVVENCRVLSLEKVQASNYFSVCVSENDSVKYYRGKLVIVASGAQNGKNIPPFAKNISPAVIQLHACDYRKASFLPDGAVLVVGSAQSGVQVAEDLIEAGRKVFISTSKVARVPRRYRGKDIVDWLLMTGFYDVRTVDVTDPQVLMMRQPQISGTGVRGHTLSLQLLARNGAVILGKIKDAYDLKGFL